MKWSRLKNLQSCCVPVIKFSSRTCSIWQKKLRANGFSRRREDDQNIKQNNKIYLLILFFRDLFPSILGNPGAVSWVSRKGATKVFKQGWTDELFHRRLKRLSRLFPRPNWLPWVSGDALRRKDQFAVCFAICVFFTGSKCRALLELVTELISGCYHCFCCSVLNFIYLYIFM